MKISTFIFIFLITTIQLKISAQNFERTILTYEEVRKINGIVLNYGERLIICGTTLATVNFHETIRIEIRSILGSVIKQTKLNKL